MPQKPKPKLRTKSRAKARKKGATISKIDKLEIGKSLGFPRTKTVMLKYVDHCRLNGSLGTILFNDYGANSVYDPDITGSGHQPFGLDQQFLFYNHAFVKSSAIKVRIPPKYIASGPNYEPFVVGIYLSDDSANYLDWRTIAETNRGTHLITSAQMNGQVQELIAKFDHKKFFNGRPNGANEFLNSDIAGPSETAIYKVYAQDARLSGNTVDITLEIEILYEVEFTEPKDLAGS